LLRCQTVLQHVHAELKSVLGFIRRKWLEKALPKFAETCPELLLMQPEQGWLLPVLRWLEATLQLSEADAVIAVEREPRLLSAMHYKRAFIDVDTMLWCDLEPILESQCHDFLSFEPIGSHICGRSS
jgi:hypothetical protein